MLGIELARPFMRMTWTEAIDKYGSDKPDLRFGMELADLTKVFDGAGITIFQKEIDKGGVVKGIFVPHELKRSEIEELEAAVKKRGFPGIAWVKSAGGEISGPLASKFSDKLKKDFAKKEGVSILLAGPWEKVCWALGDVRLESAEMLKLKKGMEILWVTDFPLFEWSEQDKAVTSAHHPFTSPSLDRVSSLFEKLSDQELMRIPSRAYDIVINGVEVGGGSIRITDRALQEKIFEILGIDKKAAQAKFGMLLDAFDYGVPPHGGLAFGFDRLLQVMLGKDSIRDVIAFPKGKSGRALMEDAPAKPDEKTVGELGISVKKVK
jgi:aspartyl-tRNA synthetase